MKKIILFCIACTVFLSQWFAYDIQPGDNALLNTIYNKIDEKTQSNPDSMVKLYNALPYLTLKYATSEKDYYFLDKIKEYLTERLFAATNSSQFICFHEYVQNNDTVTISYDLVTDEWKNISLSKGEYTLQETNDILFNPGNWKFIQWIEYEVLWLTQWARKWVEIQARNAYWSHEKSLVVALPRHEVEKISSELLEIDQRIHMYVIYQWNAVKMQGFIKNIWTESVLIDFNEPLAWHALLWVLKVESLFKHCN